MFVDILMRKGTMKDYLQELKHIFQILDLITIENVNKSAKGLYFHYPIFCITLIQSPDVSRRLWSKSLFL